jgi:hypothetical protein
MISHVRRPMLTAPGTVYHAPDRPRLAPKLRTQGNLALSSMNSDRGTEGVVRRN